MELCFKKPQKTRFSSFLFTFKLRALSGGAIRGYLRPEFQKLVEQKLFLITEGNFSVPAAKRIRET
jgi:hypothetical protein